MFNLKFILQNFNLIKKNCQLRKVTVDLDLIKNLAQKRSSLIQESEKIQATLNKIAKEIEKIKGKKEKEKLIKEGQKLKILLKEKKIRLQEVETILKEEKSKIPNFTHPKTPIGLSEKDNLEVKRIGKIPKFSFKPKNHLEINKLIEIFDFEIGSQTTGHKFYFLKNDGVFLELALINYALEILSQKDFKIFITPNLAKLEIIEGIGFLPRGPESQIYQLKEENLGLIATAEITLGGIFKDKIIEEEKLPLKLSGLSYCYRREAGAYGKTSKGLYRVHQFPKVEMFIFSRPEDSEKMLDHLLEIEMEIFQGLEIPFRVVDCCTAELGGSAYRKFDIEAWLPGENKWGEITSASNCTDYQAQRLNIKFKPKGKKAELIHTLNATALATPRVLIALLENFQQADGSVIIPSVLRKYFNKEKITPF